MSLGPSPSDASPFPGRLRWTDVRGENGRKVQPSRDHLVGYRLCQEEPTGRDDQDRLLQGLDQHHHQVLVESRFQRFNESGVASCQAETVTTRPVPGFI